MPAHGSATLAFMNACFNATAGTLALAAFISIRTGRRDWHRGFMLGAVGASMLFLVSYLIRITQFGNTPYQGVGAMRTVYLIVLASHVLLSMVVVVLVPRALYLGHRGRFVDHRRVARIAFPIWLYVSITGVAVYNFLY